MYMYINTKLPKIHKIISNLSIAEADSLYCHCCISFTVLYCVYEVEQVAASPQVPVRQESTSQSLGHAEVKYTIIYH